MVANLRKLNSLALVILQKNRRQLQYRFSQKMLFFESDL